MPTSAPNESFKKVLLVDDHPIVRQGLRMFIDATDDLRVCGEAESYDEGIKEAETHHPDIVLIDLSLKGQNGIDLLRELRGRFPQMPMLVLSMHDESLHAERALRAGALGYIMKEEATDTVINAIRKVLKGEFWVSERVSGRMLSKMVAGTTKYDRSPLDSLTDREMQVYLMIGQGTSLREIAGKLNLSIKTVETHRDHIKQKLQLGSGAELLRHAMQHVMDQQATAI